MIAPVCGDRHPDGVSPRRGHARAGQRSGGEHQLVGGSERIGAGGNLVVAVLRREPPAAQEAADDAGGNVLDGPRPARQVHAQQPAGVSDDWVAHHVLASGIVSGLGIRVQLTIPHPRQDGRAGRCRQEARQHEHPADDSETSCRRRRQGYPRRSGGAASPARPGGRQAFAEDPHHAGGADDDERQQQRRQSQPCRRACPARFRRAAASECTRGSGSNRRGNRRRRSSAGRPRMPGWASATPRPGFARRSSA